MRKLIVLVIFLHGKCFLCVLSFFFFLSRLSSKNTGTGKGIDGRAEDLET